MVTQLTSLDPATVAANLDRVRAEIAAAGRDPERVEILAAIKYLPADLLPALAAGGVTIVGENRAQALEEKQAAVRWMGGRGGAGGAGGSNGGGSNGDGSAGESSSGDAGKEHDDAGKGRDDAGTSSPAEDLFTAWDFIGQLQSRKVKDLLGRVRYIHSLASESALQQLNKHDGAGTQVLIEVNIAADPGKSGIAPDQLGAFIARCELPVAGLMTMPPHAEDPEQSRPHFRRLKALADEHNLTHLSMGTTQDYRVALQEGATIIRLGNGLFTAS